MSSVLAVVSQKSTLSKAQKNFDSLRNRVEKLKGQLGRLEADLDEGLGFFNGVLVPARRKTQKALQNCAKLFNKFYLKPPKSFSSKERVCLEDLLLDTINRVLQGCSREQQDPEILAIYKDITGNDFNEEKEALLSAEKAAFEDEMRQFGLEMDLSDLDLQQDEEVVKSQFVEKLKMLMGEFKEDHLADEKQREKTKKQKERERREALIVERQNQGLSIIYKQLVKAVHPDSEMDPIIKVEKEEFLKRVTVAYEAKDLCELLALELDWLNRSGRQETEEGGRRVIKEDILEVYNSMLRDQAQQLQQLLQLLPVSFRYFDIMEYGKEPREMLNNLRQEVDIVERQFRLYDQTGKDLMGRAPVKSLRRVLVEYCREVLISDLDDYFSRPI